MTALKTTAVILCALVLSPGADGQTTTPEQRMRALLLELAGIAGRSEAAGCVAELSRARRAEAAALRRSEDGPGLSAERLAQLRREARIAYERAKSPGTGRGASGSCASEAQRLRGVAERAGLTRAMEN